MLARLLVVGLALAAIAVGATSLHADHRCSQLKADLKNAPVAALPAITSSVVERCGDPRDSALATLVLTARGQRPIALDLARRMTEAHPDDYLGWFIVWRLSGDPRALTRAHDLNPRGTPTPR